jgi:hypothetical protein
MSVPPLYNPLASIITTTNVIGQNTGIILSNNGPYLGVGNIQTTITVPNLILANLNVIGLYWQGGSVGNTTGVNTGATTYGNVGSISATVRIVSVSNPPTYLSGYIQSVGYNNPTIYVNLGTPFTGTVYVQYQEGNTVAGTWITGRSLTVTNVSNFYISTGVI